MTSSSHKHKGHLHLSVFLLIPPNCYSPASNQAIRFFLSSNTIAYMTFCPQRSSFLHIMLMRFSLTILLKYVISQYHSIYLSLPLYFSHVTLLLLLSHKCWSSIIHFISQLQNPTSPTHITLLPFKTLFCQLFYIQKHNLITALYNLYLCTYLSYSFCQVPSQQNHWLYNSVYPLISCKINTNLN